MCTEFSVSNLVYTFGTSLSHRAFKGFGKNPSKFRKQQFPFRAASWRDDVVSGEGITPRKSGVLSGI